MTDTRTEHRSPDTTQDESARVRSEIDDTREHLGQTAEAIGDRVIPSRIIDRKKQSTARRMRGMRDRIMGTAHDTHDQMAGSAGSAVDHLRDAPESLAHRTEGSPLAAGAVAFTVGVLAAAVWRPTATERHVVEKATEAAPSLTSDVAEMGREAADTVKERAAGATEEIKSSVADAGTAMKSAATGNAETGDGPDRSTPSPTGADGPT